ncbi:MAG: 4-(cytidine 5'-diphospho)-2-C-methyl-D-erythritol kinase [Nitrospirae bacterium]|nr:4-(cytidine 5'-diphospho)-2-C-methyl-D-erythritol kinase [Nitrospirota bacterium]
MTGGPGRITIRTPAKINLLLRIKGKRSDGYHNIVTVMQMVDLWDELIIDDADVLELICKDREVPSDQENLVYKAAATLKECSDVKRGARIVLNKNIPVAAGLGGGSSDAAATLVGLNILWGLGYATDRLAVIGREIGSDVPFFLYGPAAVGYGRGDELNTLLNQTDYWFLLVNPGIQVSTAWAYCQFSSCHSELVSESHEMLKQVQHDKKQVHGDRKQVHGDIRNSCKWIGPFLPQTKLGLTNGDVHIKIFLPDGFKRDGNKIWFLPFNDLEEVVIKRYPIIRKIKEEMVACGAMCSLMSGSGSTVFGIFKDRDSAERACRTLRHSKWRSWVVSALHSSPYSSINY